MEEVLLEQLGQHTKAFDENPSEETMNEIFETLLKLSEVVDGRKLFIITGNVLNKYVFSDSKRHVILTTNKNWVPLCSLLKDSL